MGVIVVVGGQYGSEGKGKVASYFTKARAVQYCVRVGGPNSGHTVYKGGEKLIFRMLPTGIIEDGVTAVLPAGSYINLKILKNEMKIAGVDWDRVLIDDNAVIVNQEDITFENLLGLQKSIGSTLSGTGAAVISRIKRNPVEVMLARDVPDLKTCDTLQILNQAQNRRCNILIEGTQGFGLSLLHSKDYPYVTSRDTSAAAFVSECGLSPFDVTEVIMVLRAFPIRVSGNSGPLANEIDWKTVQNELGREEDMTEYTSCTNRIRRVGRFDAEVVKRAIMCNKPSKIVLNHMDYIDEPMRSGRVTDRQLRFIEDVERQIGRRIDCIGNNPYTIE